PRATPTSASPAVLTDFSLYSFVPGCAVAGARAQFRDPSDRQRPRPWPAHPRPNLRTREAGRRSSVFHAKGDNPNRGIKPTSRRPSLTGRFWCRTLVSLGTMRFFHHTGPALADLRQPLPEMSGQGVVIQPQAVAGEHGRRTRREALPDFMHKAHSIVVL